jgi:CII-binding regulator of phage lambda lysogenization HflD
LNVQAVSDRLKDAKMDKENITAQIQQITTQKQQVANSKEQLLKKVADSTTEVDSFQKQRLGDIPRIQ